MIILASASPRRKRLMEEEISSSFTVIAPSIDESLSFKSFHNVEDIVRDIAKRKCLAVAKDHQDDLVIAADTVVVIDNQIIGKPKDKEDAYRMLKMLSNHEHHVYTGFAIHQKDQLFINVTKSDVYFNELSDELINEYIASGSPMDKAGAYGYQDNHDFALVKRIDGSISNVIGFPLEDIKNALKEHFDLSLL